MTQRQKTILAIDDNEDIRQLVTFILEDAGFKVLSCSNGDEGLNLAESEQPDLILLDSMMPGINGLEVLARLRRNEEQRVNAVPVLMLTAKSSHEDQEIALILGASSYLVKPFKPEKLVEKILSIFEGEKYGLITSQNR